ncbi:MAG: TlpA family protein disulfide reductase [Rudanella sp.]|nr:TlpA family protein disulfide reductase [Rudanella sp.]
MKSIIYVVGLFLTVQSFAQSNIRVGEPAPPIIVTDWIANVPGDKDLTSYPVVLEFWATWCAPCIAAVPHLNELQSQFAHTGLRFLSLTDESTDKVNRLLKRVDFQSIVASDQTKKTQIAYGNGKTELEAFPLTVFIDNKGMIRWIGDPNYLDKEILQNLLEGNPPPKNENQGTPKPSGWSFGSGMASTISSLDPSKQHLQVMKDADKLYHFEMRETKQATCVTVSSKGRGTFFSSSTLNEIWEAAFKVRPLNLVVPDTLLLQQYVLSYKNIRPNENFLDTLSANILNHLKMKVRTDTLSKMVYKCVLNDSSKLERTTNRPGTSGYSDSGSTFMLNGQTLDEAFSLISTQSKEPFVGLLNVDGRFDFKLNRSSTETLTESLRSYGFTVTKVIERIGVIRLVSK